MKVLFASVPGLGHINPMLPLATALRDDLGHDVRWAVAPGHCAYLEERGFTVHPAGLGEERWARLSALGHGRPFGQPSPAFFAALFGEVLTAPMLTDLQDIVAGWAPDLFVHDFNEFASAPLATLLGRPHVTHGFGAGPPPANLAAAGETVAPLWQALGLAAPPNGGVHQHAVVDIYPGALVARPPLPCRRLALRPAERNGAAAPPAWWSELRQRPTVYLTFGTIFTTNPAILQGAIDGLADLDVNVVMTTGGAPGGEIRAAPNTRVFAYVPQEMILPRVSAVVSHAGSGTFLGSLAYGLPQVCIPQGADQFLNSSIGAAAGVAVVVAPDAHEAAAVRAAAREVLENTAMRARAAAVAVEIEKMPGAPAVAEEIAALYL